MLAMLVASVVIFALICIAAVLENWASWLFVLAIPFVLGKCASTDDYIQHEKEVDAEQAANWKAKTTPRVLSSTPNGCTVYVFTTDRDHYFTRCGDRVTTDTNYSESCGKNCTKQKTETITTEGNK